ncbi:MAG TPA: PAS domain S-box protein [Geothrix sp.]|nr:PAS domain S-box protein [Geothrix sp.]
MKLESERVQPRLFLWAGVILGMGFWVVEAFLHAFLFHRNAFRQELFPLDDPHELWMRSLIFLGFTAFGLLTEVMYSRLRASEEKFAKAFKTTPDAININRLDDGVFISINEGFTKITGYAYEDVIGRSSLARGIDLWVHPEDRAKLLAGLKAHGEVVGLEAPFRMKSGEVITGLMSAKVIEVHDEPCILSVTRDISDRKAAEAALKASEAHFRAFFDNAPVPTWEEDFSGVHARFEQLRAEGVRDLQAHLAAHPEELQKLASRITILDVNEASLAVMGAVSKADLIRDLHRYFTEESLPAFRAEMIALFNGEVRFEAELPILDIQGRRHELHLRLAVLQGMESPLSRVLVSFTDITERKAATLALRQSEKKYRTVADYTFDWEFWRTPDGSLPYVSPSCERITGYRPEEFQADPDLLLAIVHPEDQSAVKDHLALSLRGEAFCCNAVEFRIQARDGQERWIGHLCQDVFDQNGTYLGRRGSNRDITEKKRSDLENIQLEAQLLQAQKMESLGILAGGIAHDMNNVLGAILGMASIHIGTQPYGSPLHHALTTICKATERGGEMVRRLLNFARQSPAEEREVDINELLREEMHMLERTTMAKVRLELDLAPDLRPIRGDANALTHALMNLCVNAVDAMPDNGTLTLRTRNVGQDRVEVLVEDTGTGMPKEVLERALDPFFTTKGVGKGTGLGLSMVFTTVKAHQGELEIQSEPGQGTCVRLCFPVGELERQAPRPTDSGETRMPRDVLKILLVDDDELVQISSQAILEFLGHAVVTVSSGEGALASIAGGYEPDVVILDMNMPGLGGAGTLPRLRELRPTMPVLLSTGRADQTAMDLVGTHARVTLLAKPFGMRELQQHLEPIGRARGALLHS